MVHRGRAVLAVSLLLLICTQLGIPTGAFAAIGIQVTGTPHLSGSVSNLSVDPADVPVMDTGQHRVTASMNDEGKVTETQQVTFNATFVTHNTSRASTNTPRTLTLAKVNQWLVPGLVLLAVMVLAVGTMMVVYHRRDRRRRLSKFTIVGTRRPVVPSNGRQEDERFGRGLFFHRVPPTRPVPPMPEPAPEARKSILKPIGTGSRKRQ